MEHRTLPRPLKIAALALFCAAVAVPCSWDTTPILFFEARPDAPIDAYVDGHLGIVQPTYARSHLIVAWRYLSGNPPTESQREGFRDLLRYRLKEYPEGSQPVDPAEQWERLRTTVRGVAYQYPPDRTRSASGSYDYYTNCGDDAFATASTTLAQRMKTFGATSPAVTKWLDAQELVFANCSSDEEKIPDDDPALPAVLRADRQYQIAAANFYAANFGTAREQFLQIARDAQSPWQKVARLVAVRSLIRAENLGGSVDEEDPLAAADRELRAILADPAMQPLHDAAWDLLAVTTLRRDPEQRFSDAAKGLMGSETSARRVRVDLADYTVLFDKDVAGDDELTDWIRTFQGGDVAHAMEQWEATKGMQWLVAALTHVKPGDAAVTPLLAASQSLASSSPAATTVAFHRARLLLAMDHDDEAHAELDRALAAEIPVSARNQLLALRRALAPTLADYLRDVPVRPVGFGEDTTDPATAAPQLPRDAAVTFNYWTDLDTLAAAVESPSLPDDIRTKLQRAAWTRAVVLDRVDIAKRVTPTFEESLAAKAAAWAKAPKSERAFAAADVIVHDTGLQPYVEPFDFGYSNWWCGGGPPYDRGDVDSTKVPDFLAREDSANAESDALYKEGPGASWILRNVLARAKSHPNDERVPEALSLAVLGTRRACGDDATAALAKKAFEILHRRYGNTTWAKETPYWYKPGS